MLYRATGGAWGSSFINARYEELLERIFGRSKIDVLRANEECWNEMMDKFEKCKIRTEYGEEGRFRTHHMFKKTLGKKKGVNKACDAYLKTIQNEDFMMAMKGGDILRMSYAMIEGELFNPIVEPIIAHIGLLLDGIDPETKQRKAQLENIQYLFHVGGFAGSKILQEKFNEFCGERGIRYAVPNDPQKAILDGAVRFGLNPSAISARCSQLTYGTDVYNEGFGQMSGKCFDKFVERDQECGINQVISRKYVPKDANQRSIRSNIYATTHPNPKFVTDKGCKLIGNVVLSVPATQPGQQRPVMRLDMKFGRTVIEVTAINESTGEEVMVEVDFIDDGKNDPSAAKRSIPDGKELVLDHTLEYKTVESNVRESFFLLLASVRAPFIPLNQRKPIDMVLVIDVSGSMAGESINLVKKSMCFILERLNHPEDRLGLVTFGHGARPVFNMTKMSSSNRGRCREAVMKLEADECSTNL